MERLSITAKTFKVRAAGRREMVLDLRAKGLSQMQIAAIVNISQPRVCQILKGSFLPVPKRKPYAPRKQKIARMILMDEALLHSA